MSGYVLLPETEDGDNGGVHINSGIPNHAFYLAASAIGGHAWETAGHVWYESLLASSQTTQFQDFADTTYAKAGQLYGSGGSAQKAVQSAWREVGIKISGAAPASISVRPTALPEDSLADLVRHVQDISNDVKALAEDVGRLKARK
jgi:hypothetical protein